MSAIAKIIAAQQEADERGLPALGRFAAISESLAAELKAESNFVESIEPDANLLQPTEVQINFPIVGCKAMIIAKGQKEDVRIIDAAEFERLAVMYA